MRIFVMPKTIDQWMDLWWVRIPARVRNWSEPLAAMLTDGMYLCAWPKLGASSPALALAVGFLAGQHYLFGGETYSHSLAILAVFVTIGWLGSGLGAQGNRQKKGETK